MVRIKAKRPALYSFRLKSAFIVSRIAGDQQYATWFQDLHGVFQGRQSGVAPGDYSALASRQPPKVKNDSSNGMRYPLGKLCVATVEQRHPFRQCCGVQALVRTSQCCRLDIEGPDVAGFTYQLGQQQGVLAVATGGVHRLVARSNEMTKQQVAQRDRSPQGRHISGHMLHGRQGSKC